jgi:endonuclease/exonuclease/phosphatase family metal-dependent hydrolase
MAKKRLHFIDKCIYFLNAIFAFLLLLSYVVPFVSPTYLPFISILNFGIPPLLLVNAIFLLYWILKLRKQFLLSGIILLLGYSHITSLYVFSDEKEDNVSGLKLMSYNIRHFNYYKWIDNENLVDEMEEFIIKESPDIIAFQDFNPYSEFNLDDYYPYRYPHNRGKNDFVSTPFYSKYPILYKQEIAFPNTGNSALFVDLKLPNDTIRIFNLHLQSLKIKPDVKELQNENRRQLLGRVGQSFKKQAEQIEILLPYIENSPYKNIITGDFNNSAFSYVYRKLKENNLKDAFKEKGNGFGKTFDFDFIPIRIDHVLVDEEIEVLDFKNYSIKLSDHYPIMAEFKLP